MSSKNIYLFFAIFLVAGTIALAAYNTGSAQMRFASMQFDVPLYVFLLKGFAAGGLTVFCIWRMQRQETKNEQKKLEWKTEDAKLQTEIQADKVHQLELQVKTLETALDKALKRGKS